MSSQIESVSVDGSDALLPPPPGSNAPRNHAADSSKSTSSPDDSFSPVTSSTQSTLLPSPVPVIDGSAVVDKNSTWPSPLSAVAVGQKRIHVGIHDTSLNAHASKIATDVQPSSNENSSRVVIGGPAIKFSEEEDDNGCDDTDGEFIRQGQSSDTPRTPSLKSNEANIANISLPGPTPQSTDMIPDDKPIGIPNQLIFDKVVAQLDTDESGRFLEELKALLIDFTMYEKLDKADSTEGHDVVMQDFPSSITKQRFNSNAADVEVGAVQVNEQAPQINRRFFRGLDRPSVRALNTRLRQERQQGSVGEHGELGVLREEDQEPQSGIQESMNRSRPPRISFMGRVSDLVAHVCNVSETAIPRTAYAPLVTATLVEDDGEVVVAERVGFFERKWKGFALCMCFFLVLMAVFISIGIAKRVGEEPLMYTTEVPSMQPSMQRSFDSTPTLQVAQTRG